MSQASFSQQPVPPSYPITPSVVSGFSQETDRLFQKWLKLQIAQFYWGFITKIVLFLLIAGSIIFSTITLAPIVSQQLKLLMDLQSTLGGVSAMTAPFTNNQTGTGASSTTPGGIPFDVTDIIRELNPGGSKESLEKLLKQAQQVQEQQAQQEQAIEEADSESL